MPAALEAEGLKLVPASELYTLQADGPLAAPAGVAPHRDEHGCLCLMLAVEADDETDYTAVDAQAVLAALAARLERESSDGHSGEVRRTLTALAPILQRQRELTVRVLRGLQQRLNTAWRSAPGEALEYLPIMEGEVNQALFDLGGHSGQRGVPAPVRPDEWPLTAARSLLPPCLAA